MNPHQRPHINAEFNRTVINTEAPMGAGKPGKRPEFIQRNARVRHAERPKFAGTVKDAGVHRYAMVLWDGSTEPRECDYVRLIPEAGYVEPVAPDPPQPKRVAAAKPRTPRVRKVVAPKPKPEIIIPEKACLICGVRMERLKRDNGTLEHVCQFKARKTCASRECIIKQCQGPRTACPPRECPSCHKTMKRRRSKSSGYLEHPSHYAERKHCDDCRHLSYQPGLQLTPEKRAAILADVQEGRLRGIQIAANHGVAMSTVSRIKLAAWLKSKEATA